MVDVVLKRDVAADIAVGEKAAGLGSGHDPETCVIHLTVSGTRKEQPTCHRVGSRRRGGRRRLRAAGNWRAPSGRPGVAIPVTPTSPRRDPGHPAPGALSCRSGGVDFRGLHSSHRRRNLMSKLGQRVHRFD